MSKQLKIHLLGGIEVTLNDKPVTGLGTRKAEGLLAYLACHKRPFPRELLADFLWDDREQGQALANLRSILSVLGRKLKPYLTITRQTVAFNHDSNYWLDITEFEHNLQAPHSPIADLEEGIALYRGDFLEGFYMRECRGFEEWSILERERLQRLAIVGLRQLIDNCVRNGRFHDALNQTDRLIQLDDLSEYAHRQKMMMLLRTGQRTAALRHYDNFYQLLEEELATAPSPDTQAIAEQIRAITFPPPLKLPSDFTPFVGRKEEQAALIAQLNATNMRLLTLFGSGGMGKTRLAIATARQLYQRQPGRFLDGTFFIPLTAVSTPTALPTYIADAIDLPFSGNDSPQQQLLAHLQDKEMLLILDNYEHLLSDDAESVALLVEIMKSAPKVTLFVTSRERLNLYGEQIFELEGLTLPSTDTDKNSDAAQLFLQHGQQVNPRFAPAETELPLLVRICQLLDGTPLAIELAAGWVRDHNLSQIVAQIEKDLDFLQTSYRNSPARQRSLRAVFNYSWQLLRAENQAHFARLSIFPDSFTKEAAMAITAVSNETFRTLMDKSLVQSSGEDGRYQIHALLRQYAAEKLFKDDHTLKQTHSAHFLQWVAQLDDGSAPVARTVIRTDLPNVEAAWLAATAVQNYTLLSGAATNLHSFYSAQSWFQEGIAMFQQAVAHLPEEATGEQASALCDLLGRKARMHIHIGQLSAAKRDLETAVHYLPQVNDQRRSAMLGYLAITTYYAGDYTQAIELATEGLELSQKLNDIDGVAFGYNFLGSCAKAQGDYPLAHSHFEQSVETYRQLGDEMGMGMVINNLGNLAQARHHYEAAQQYYEQCSAIFKAHNHTHGAATTLANAGRLALKLENYETAVPLLQESLTLKEAAGDQRGMAVALVGLGEAYTAIGDLDSAKHNLTQALQLAHKSGHKKLILETIVGCANWLWQKADETVAKQLLSFVLNHSALVEEIREAATAFAEKWGNSEAPFPYQTIDEVVEFLSRKMTT